MHKFTLINDHLVTRSRVQLSLDGQHLSVELGLTEVLWSPEGRLTLFGTDEFRAHLKERLSSDPQQFDLEYTLRKRTHKVAFQNCQVATKPAPLFGIAFTIGTP